MTQWTAQDIPPQNGRTVVVTGANSGLGAVTAGELAKAGARVVLACRDVAKGEKAADAMTGEVEVRRLDLADLSSIAEFAAGIDGDVAVLINNAGVMAVPHRRTADGFEMQLGTNHLGHFALTGLLLDQITDRVVTVSSMLHKPGRIKLDDLNWEHRRYRTWLAYAQSKLANLLFAYELQRRLARAGSPVRSTAAHPGYASTNLQGKSENFTDRFTGPMNRLLAQSAELGALPTLYAATVPDLPGGSFIGPDGFAQQHGHPTLVQPAAKAKDTATAAALWEASETLTQVRYLD